MMKLTKTGICLAAMAVLPACPSKKKDGPPNVSVAATKVASKKMESLTIGIAIPSYVHAVAWISEDKGFWRQQGLRTDVKVMGGSAASMRALIGGSIDVAFAGGDAAIKANAAGAKLVVIGGLVNRFYHRLVGRKELADAAALKGKRIGLPFLGGPQDMAVRYALRKLKLGYGNEVKVLGLGKEFNRMAALSKGEIDATTSQTPPSKLAQLGLKVLMDLPAENVNFPYAVVVVRRQVLDQRREALGQMLAGLCQGIAFYRDPKNKEASLALIAKRLGKNADTGGASAERYQLAGPRLLSYPPRPTAAAFEMVLGFLNKSDKPTLQPKALFELSLLEQAIQRGLCGRTIATTGG